MGDRMALIIIGVITMEIIPCIMLLCCSAKKQGREPEEKGGFEELHVGWQIHTS